MNSYKRANLVYEGKAKKIYSIEGQEDAQWLEFKDSLTAFNGKKEGSFEGKGEVNRDISSYLFKFLKNIKIKNHWLADVNKTSMICRRLKIIPLEVVIRNTLAGSTAQRLGFEEGLKVLKEPLVELYYKKDELKDPFISDDQAVLLQACTHDELKNIKNQAVQINKHLQNLFLIANITLIDFKLEFGFDNLGEIILGDEISPDCCRLWDVKSKEKMDKDRFRRDLGKIEENYREILRRLKELEI